jgi:SRSO17 transposase
MQADPNKKNMERMEERVPESDQQQLNHMLTDSAWDHQAVMNQVALEADRWLGGHHNSCLLIDESGFRKSGKHSVGVARQWCGRWGKVDNCQVGVFAALGRGHRAALVDERLYLPESWVDDAGRCRRAGIPKPARVFKTKAQLSCSDIEELLRHFLPKRAVTKEEVMAQMEKRHEKRLASIQQAYRKQGIMLLE